MSLIAKQTGSDRVPAPAGTHLAICYAMFDLGTQTTVFNNVTKKKKKVRIVWELPSEKMADGRPFSVGVFYTNSLHKKSTLRAHLEAWRGKAFTEKELEGFNLTAILGKPCMLNIVHKVTAEATYDNVGAVMALPKGMPVPPITNKTVSFDIDEWNQAAYDALPDFLKAKIMQSPEGAAKMGFAPAVAGANPPIDGAAYDPTIPF